MQTKVHWCSVFNSFLCSILKLSKENIKKKSWEKPVLKIWSQIFEEKNLNVWKHVNHTVFLALKQSNIFILKDFCKRTHCPPIVTLALLLFIPLHTTLVFNIKFSDPTIASKFFYICVNLQYTFCHFQTFQRFLARLKHLQPLYSPLQQFQFILKHCQSFRDKSVTI